MSAVATLRAERTGRRLRPARLVALFVALLLMAPACGGGGRNAPAVTSHLISDPTMPDMRVLAPEGKGPWPVVVALHGVGGTGRDMLALGTRLARAGNVVFLPTYNTDLSTAEGYTRASDDLSCSYQVARREAPAHGGDLTQPVTAVGWSLGADLAVLGSLGPASDPSTGRCPGTAPRPDVVVALSGCFREFEGRPVTWFDDLTGWTNKDASVRLVAGDADTTCPAEQTDEMAEALRGAGYDVTVTRLTSADHGAPIFHDQSGHTRTRDAAGDRAVRIVLDAIRSAGAHSSGPGG